MVWVICQFQLRLTGDLKPQLGEFQTTKNSDNFETVTKAWQENFLEKVPENLEIVELCQPQKGFWLMTVMPNSMKNTSLYPLQRYGHLG